jgi:ABC-type multidrug transport system ATPase subunit
MDEISSGLDSSTTYEIIKSLSHFAHYLDYTILISLLQPAPETYDLFDDIILLSEGYIVYQGPREHVLDFFKGCGFKCPERKGIADFLQEVTSQKDQAQYWFNQQKCYQYIPPNEFANRFEQYHVGKSNKLYMSVPFEKSKGHEMALSFTKHTVSNVEILKTCFAREVLLIRRNSFVFIFRTTQVLMLVPIPVLFRVHVWMHACMRYASFTV